jgi:uncharacterized OB-fold protein
MSVETRAEARTLVCGGGAVEIGPDRIVYLVGGACADCGAIAFPRAPVCSVCMGEDIRSARLPRRGTLYAFSTVHVAPKRWQLPMRIGYVDLENGVRVFTHLVGEDFAVGDAVEPDIAAVGADSSGILESFVFKRVAR